MTLLRLLPLPLLLCLPQVMIEAASSEEQKTPEYRTRKLESLTRQNELIEEENRKREEAKQAQVWDSWYRYSRLWTLRGHVQMQMLDYCRRGLA